MNERAVRLLLNGAGAAPENGHRPERDFRCVATEAMMRCVYDAGHDGPHLWEDVDRFRRSLDELVERADRILARREEEARALVAFADGLEEAGEATYARRSRSVARDLLETARELREERSLRVAIQNERDRVRRFVSRNGYDGKEEG